MPANSSSDVPRMYWEDFREGDVREFGGMVVEHDEIVRFATAYDPQPFHVDDEAARQSMFGGLIASGWHTAAMAMRMMCDAYLLRAASLGSPGIEQLKWLKPVRPGDRLHMRLTVLESRELRSRPGVGLVKSRHEVINQDDDVVMQMEGYGMFGRRPA